VNDTAAVLNYLLSGFVAIFWMEKSETMVISNSSGCHSASPPLSSVRTRAQTASLVPFFLRAWWLRDRLSSSDLVFGDYSIATLPLFSMHSDPVCDVANMDVYAV